MVSRLTQWTRFHASSKQFLVTEDDGQLSPIHWTRSNTIMTHNLSTLNSNRAQTSDGAVNMQNCFSVRPLSCFKLLSNCLPNLLGLFLRLLQKQMNVLGSSRLSLLRRSTTCRSDTNLIESYTRSITYDQDYNRIKSGAFPTSWNPL